MLRGTRATSSRAISASTEAQSTGSRAAARTALVRLGRWPPQTDGLIASEEVLLSGGVLGEKKRAIVTSVTARCSAYAAAPQRPRLRIARANLSLPRFKECQRSIAAVAGARTGRMRRAAFHAVNR